MFLKLVYFYFFYGKSQTILQQKKYKDKKP